MFMLGSCAKNPPQENPNLYFKVIINTLIPGQENQDTEIDSILIFRGKYLKIGLYPDKGGDSVVALQKIDAVVKDNKILMLRSFMSCDKGNIIKFSSPDQFVDFMCARGYEIQGRHKREYSFTKNHH